MKNKIVQSFVVAGSLLFGAGLAHAGEIIYANSAGTDGIQVFNVDVAAGTETLIDSFKIAAGNGRGVVTVGDTLYYTDANSGDVSTYTLSTHTDNGALFAVAGATGLATMAYDGTDLYLGDYSGTNNVYKYTLGGTLLSTVALSDCTGFCDGLEYANGGLVSNRTDGGFGTPSTYDAYSLAGGAPTTAGLITTSFGATGIAYDNTYYFVSDIFHDQFAVYDSTGTFVKDIALADGHHTNAIEDLSVNYAARVDTGGAPEPSTWLMMLSGMGMAVYYRRTRRA